MTPIIAIIGWKNSGKTTLTERIIAELSVRHYRVASIKHAHHAFDIDHAGTDSFRHRKAGAVTTILASARRVAMMQELDEGQEPSLDQIRTMLPPHNITIAEGYKREAIPKIALWDGTDIEAAKHWLSDNHVTALVSRNGTTVKSPLPQFQADDITAIVDHIENALNLTQ